MQTFNMKKDINFGCNVIGLCFVSSRDVAMWLK